MKKLIAITMMLVLVLTTGVLVACGDPCQKNGHDYVNGKCSRCGVAEPKKPLTFFDVFQEYALARRYQRSYYAQGWEYMVFDSSKEGIMLGTLRATTLPIDNDYYSEFRIYTKKAAANVLVYQVSFEVVAMTDCIVQFAIKYKDEILQMSDTLTLTANTPAEVMFDKIAIIWTEEDAGNCKLVTSYEPPIMLGELGSYFVIDLWNKRDLLDLETTYYIQGLKIGFQERNK